MHKKIISTLVVFVALAVLLFVIASVISGGQRNKMPAGITNDVEWRGTFVGPKTPPHVNGPTGPAPAVFPE